MPSLSDLFFGQADDEQTQEPVPETGDRPFGRGFQAGETDDRPFVPGSITREETYDPTLRADLPGNTVTENQLEGTANPATSFREDFAERFQAAQREPAVAADLNPARELTLEEKVNTTGGMLENSVGGRTDQPLSVNHEVTVTSPTPEGGRRSVRLRQSSTPEAPATATPTLEARQPTRIPETTRLSTGDTREPSRESREPSLSTTPKTEEAEKPKTRTSGLKDEINADLAEFDRQQEALGEQQIRAVEARQAADREAARLRDEQQRAAVRETREAENVTNVPDRQEVSQVDQEVTRETTVPTSRETERETSSRRTSEGVQETPGTAEARAETSQTSTPVTQVKDTTDTPDDTPRTEVNRETTAASPPARETENPVSTTESVTESRQETQPRSPEPEVTPAATAPESAAQSAPRETEDVATPATPETQLPAPAARETETPVTSTTTAEQSATVATETEIASPTANASEARETTSPAASPETAAPATGSYTEGPLPAPTQAPSRIQPGAPAAPSPRDETTSETANRGLGSSQKESEPEKPKTRTSGLKDEINADLAEFDRQQEALGEQQIRAVEARQAADREAAKLREEQQRAAIQEEREAKLLDQAQQEVERLSSVTVAESTEPVSPVTAAAGIAGGLTGSPVTENTATDENIKTVGEPSKQSQPVAEHLDQVTQSHDLDDIRADIQAQEEVRLAAEEAADLRDVTPLDADVVETAVDGIATDFIPEVDADLPVELQPAVTGVVDATAGSLTTDQDALISDLAGDVADTSLAADQAAIADLAAGIPVTGGSTLGNLANVPSPTTTTTDQATDQTEQLTRLDTIKAQLQGMNAEQVSALQSALQSAAGVSSAGAAGLTGMVPSGLGQFTDLGGQTPGGMDLDAMAAQLDGMAGMGTPGTISVPGYGDFSYTDYLAGAQAGALGPMAGMAEPGAFAATAAGAGAPMIPDGSQSFVAAPTPGTYQDYAGIGGDIVGGPGDAAAGADIGGMPAGTPAPAFGGIGDAANNSLVPAQFVDAAAGGGPAGGAPGMGGFGAPGGEGGAPGVGAPAGGSGDGSFAGLGNLGGDQTFDLGLGNGLGPGGFGSPDTGTPGGSGILGGEGEGLPSRNARYINTEGALPNGDGSVNPSRVGGQAARNVADGVGRGLNPLRNLGTRALSRLLPGLGGAQGRIPRMLQNIGKIIALLWPVVMPLVVGSLFTFAIMGIFAWIFGTNTGLITTGYQSPGTQPAQECLEIKKTATPDAAKAGTKNVDNPSGNEGATSDRGVSFQIVITPNKEATGDGVIYEGDCEDIINIRCRKNGEGGCTNEERSLTTEVCEKIEAQLTEKNGKKIISDTITVNISRNASGENSVTTDKVKYTGASDYSLVNKVSIKAKCTFDVEEYDSSSQKTKKTTKEIEKKYTASDRACIGECGGDGMCWPFKEAQITSWPHGSKGKSAMDLGAHYIEVHAPITNDYYYYKWEQKECCVSGCYRWGSNGCSVTCESLRAKKYYNGRVINEGKCGAGCYVEFPSPNNEKQTYWIMHMIVGADDPTGHCNEAKNSGTRIGPFHYDQSDIIGLTDTTGANTGPHTHIQINGGSNVLTEFFGDEANSYSWHDMIGNKTKGGPGLTNPSCDW